MDINYFMKIQNAYGTKNKREKELAEINREVSKHFKDTVDTETVLINGIPRSLMIIKDTDGNTFKKKIKSRHDDKFNIGDYVNWNGQHWLVTLIDTDEKTWNRGYMYLCTVPLRWQNPDGKIIERWAYSEDYTKYSSGIKGNNSLMLADNQYGLTLPIDSETKKLHRDLRFPIDFDDAEIPDIYKLTNRKVSLNNNEYFNRGGTMILTLSYDAFNSNKDKLVTLNDGSQVWICDYHSPAPSDQSSNPEKNPILCKIECSSPTVKIGSRFKSFKGIVTDSTGNPLDKVGYFSIISDFSEKITLDTSTINQAKIKIADDHNDLSGKSFDLIFTADAASTTSAITISE